MSSDAQFLELLIHLKKAQPAEARRILNDQPPQIGHALISLMMKIGAVDAEVVKVR